MCESCTWNLKPLRRSGQATQEQAEHVSHAGAPELDQHQAAPLSLARHEEHQQQEEVREEPQVRLAVLHSHVFVAALDGVEAFLQTGHNQVVLASGHQLA